ncbi:hypothetical protein MMC21_006909 [Puttea exsequens]|nr:hypothetical protein [Puttea exsequens]
MPPFISDSDYDIQEAETDTVILYTYLAGMLSPLTDILPEGLIRYAGFGRSERGEWGDWA